MDNKTERPLGISILAVLNILSGIFFLFIWFAALSSGNIQSTPPAGSLIVQLAPLQAVLAFVAGIGLWQLLEWARLLMIGRYIFLIAVTIFSSFSKALTGFDMMQILIGGAMIAYLMQPGVRQAFDRPRD